MNIIITTLVSLILLSVGLIVPILVGVYVYKDASRRGMNAVMWTLISLLAPSLIGFIIYLLVRSSYSDLECPRCHTTIEEKYILCPKCGAKLQPFCPQCSAPVEVDWKVCPRCAAPLTEMGVDVVVPTRKKDKSLGYILWALILIPAVLILLFVGLFTFRVSVGSDAGSTSISAVVAQEYIDEIQSEEIAAWYENCTDDRAHILMRTDECVRYLIYMPNLQDPISIGFDNNAGFFRNKLQLNYSSIGETGKECLIVVTCTGGDMKKALRISRDDEEMACVTQQTTVSIGLTDKAILVAEERYSSGGSRGEIYVHSAELPEKEFGN